jgi:hypothetical protein
VVYFTYTDKVVYYINFLYVELFLHSENKFHLVVVYNPFALLLCSVCYSFGEDFHVMFINAIGL